MISRAVGALLLAATVLMPTAAEAAPSIRTVSPGASFPVQVDGFAPGAAVQLRRIGDPAVVIRRAGRGGVLRTTWRAPRQAGDYRLAVSGAPRLPRSRAGHGLVVLIVPRVAVIPFRVRVPPPRRPGHPGHPGHPGGNGVLGEGATQGGTSGPGGTAGGPPGAARPAQTGADFAALLALGDLSVLIGIALIAVGSYRRRPACP